MQHATLTIYGKVQGVFFRDATRRKAEECGIFGYVRNDINGTVHIEAEGTKAALMAFIDWCRIGPSDAIVENVKITEGPVAGFRRFEIRYI